MKKDQVEKVELNQWETEDFEDDFDGDEVELKDGRVKVDKV